MPYRSSVTVDPTKLSERERYRVRKRIERETGVNSQSNEALLAMSEEQLDAIEKKACRR
jgi:hypothetical protein